MIAGIRGTLEAAGTDWAIVDVQGVSYRVFAPTSTLNRLPAIGQSVRLLTHLYMREDQLSLYGFLSSDELAVFEQLLGVSGVGPKLALTMLSAASAEKLRQAIASENVENLTRIPGIGRKLAGRLILELRGKLIAPNDGKPALERPVDADVAEALMGLGYSPVDAQAAIKSLPTDRQLDLEERIRLALQQFAKR
ncbi:MAG: Holliday junction branch migration protein RuvA [Chloroflexota bacterium]